MTGYKLNADRDVAVSTDVYWHPMSTCPIAVKVFLLGQGGVATVGQYNGKNGFWQGWYPCPKVRRSDEK